MEQTQEQDIAAAREIARQETREGMAQHVCAGQTARQGDLVLVPYKSAAPEAETAEGVAILATGRHGSHIAIGKMARVEIGGKDVIICGTSKDEPVCIAHTDEPACRHRALSLEPGGIWEIRHIREIDPETIMPRRAPD